MTRATESHPIGEGSLRTRLVAGSAWALICRVLNAGLTIIISAVLTRMLSPEEFAFYTLALSVVVFGSGVGMLGLNTNIVRLVAESISLRDLSRALSAVRIGYALVAIGTLVVGGLFFVWGEAVFERVFDAPLTRPLLVLIVFWMAGQSVSHFTAETYRGFHDIRSASLFSGPSGGVLYSLAVLVGLLLLWHIGEPDLLRVLVLAACIAGINVLVSLFWLRTVVAHASRRAPSEGTAADTLSARGVFRQSFPFMVSTVSEILRMSVSLWIVAWLCSKSELAVFGAVYRLVNAVTLPLLVVAAVLAPVIADLYAQTQIDRLQRVLRGAATVAAVPAVAGILLMAVGARPLLGLVYGEFYTQGANVLLIISLGHFVFVLGGVPGTALAMTGHQTGQMLITLLSTAALIVGGMLATRSFGLIGMAGMLCATTVAAKLASLIYVRARIGIWAHVQFDGGAVAFAWERLKLTTKY